MVAVFDVLRSKGAWNLSRMADSHREPGVLNVRWLEAPSGGPGVTFSFLLLLANPRSERARTSAGTDLPSVAQAQHRKGIS